MADDFDEVFELEQSQYSLDNARARLDTFIEYWDHKYYWIEKALKD
ncbi:hypothetical protein FN3523_0550 [Francisella hispaniensis]|uniref:Uncharacterized protein n=1 Tax=Francisella hispaniensis TaxID=622488 RepID=F4BJR3_9GAMM|nr:hypothetical protein FN3523_0550 [Francisella hispaniensis]